MIASSRRSNPEGCEDVKHPKQSLFRLRRHTTEKLYIPRNDILLAKPQTLMNESGTAVKAMMDFYKLLPEDLVIIHDDTDIQFGKYKIAADSRSAGHKGVQNIIDNLGTQKFKRIRIGTGKSAEEKKECPISGHNYVLGKFSEEELKNINAILESLSQIIKNER